MSEYGTALDQLLDEMDEYDGGLLAQRGGENMKSRPLFRPGVYNFGRYRS